MLATGLHQDPHQSVTYYWRLRDHAAFLSLIGVSFQRVEARMSRDFLVVCPDAQSAWVAERRLSAARAEAGEPLFEVDNRGTDLFVMFVYGRDILRDTTFRVEDEVFEDLRRHAAFVAIKNGQHNGTGYFADTGVMKSRGVAEPSDSFRLAEIPSRIVAAIAGDEPRA